MMSLDHIAEYLDRVKAPCWKLFKVEMNQASLIYEFMPKENLDMKDSIRELKEFVAFYENSGPYLYRIEPRKTSSSNQTGILARQEFTVDGTAPERNVRGLAGTQSTTVTTPPAGYITMADVERKIELMRMEMEITIKKDRLDREHQDRMDKLKERERSLSGLREKYESNVGMVQDGVGRFAWEALKGWMGNNEEGAQPLEGPKHEAPHEHQPVQEEETEKDKLVEDLAQTIYQDLDEEEIRQMSDSIKAAIAQRKQSKANGKDVSE